MVFLIFCSIRTLYEKLCQVVYLVEERSQARRKTGTGKVTMNDVKRYVGIWLLASIIVLAINLLVIWASQGFEGIISELLVNAVLESLPMPFNIIFGWYINPVHTSISFALQLVIFAVLLFIFKSAED